MLALLLGPLCIMLMSQYLPSRRHCASCRCRSPSSASFRRVSMCIASRLLVPPCISVASFVIALTADRLRTRSRPFAAASSAGLCAGAWRSDTVPDPGANRAFRPDAAAAIRPAASRPQQTDPTFARAGEPHRVSQPVCAAAAVDVSATASGLRPRCCLCEHVTSLSYAFAATHFPRCVCAFGARGHRLAD
jgi:hypothetical protein